MAKAVTMKIVAPNRRSAEEFAALINEKWQDQVKSILEVGTILETAKAELAHGEWLKMVKEKLPFGQATARKLMAIVDNEQLSNRAHVNDLPAHWGTLYELTQLSSEAFDEALAAGTIHPKMTRKDAKALRGVTPKRKADPAKPKDSAFSDPVADKLFHLQEQIERSLEELDAAQRQALVSSLRQLIDQLEE